MERGVGQGHAPAHGVPDDPVALEPEVLGHPAERQEEVSVVVGDPIGVVGAPPISRQVEADQPVFLGEERGQRVETTSVVQPAVAGKPGELA